MRSCEAIFGPEQADRIEALVVEATGLPCPCAQGQTCPLLDAAGCNPLAVDEEERQEAARVASLEIEAAVRAGMS